MRLILSFIYGVPALLVAIFLAAFVNSTQITTKKKNEFTYGTIGEAAKINPILATDESSMEVAAMIFEGLLSTDEKLDIIPWLATGYQQTQTTTFFFNSPQAASAAAQAVGGAAASHPEWKMHDVRADGSQLLVDLDLPGYRASDEIAKAFGASVFVPTATFRADLTADARKMLAAFRSAHPEVVIVRQWFDYDSAFEIAIAGDAAGAESKLRDFLKPDAKAALTRLDTRPYLAEPVIKFKLREGVRWQDGAPFTSEDCVFTFDALEDEKIASPRKSDFDLILKVDAPTPLDFVVTYRRPYSSALISWTMGLLPSHILKDKSPKWWAENFNRKPVGTGPFTFETWKTNEYTRLVKNKDYWGTGPWLDAFVFRTIPDPTSLRLAFESHQVDIFPIILSPWALQSFRDNPRFEVTSASYLAYSYIGWNLRRDLFKDIRVRKALAMAVNIPDIIKFVYYGNGQQSNGIYLPELWFSDPTLQPLPYDPEKAKQLLDEAGWKVGPDGIRVKDGKRFSFKLIANQGNDTRKDVATLVQDYYAKIGIEVKVEIYEWAVFIERFIDKREYDGVRPRLDVHAGLGRLSNLEFLANRRRPDESRRLLEPGGGQVDEPAARGIRQGRDQETREPAPAPHL